MRETTKLFFALALAAVGACKAAPPPPKPDAVAGVPAAQLPVADAPYGVVAKPKPPPPPLQVLETQPKAGERIGPDQAKLSLQFSGPIDEDAVGAALHLSPSVHGLAGGTLTADKLLEGGGTATYSVTLDLEPSMHYTLTLDKGALHAAGIELADPATPTIAFETGTGLPRMKLDRGIYTVEAGGAGAMLWTRNLDTVHVRCAPVPRDKLAQVLPKATRLLLGYANEGEKLDWTGLRGKEFNLPLQAKADKWHKQPLDLAQLCGGTQRGVVLAEVSSAKLKTVANRPWNEPPQQYLLANTTDLGLVVKAGKQSGLVWVVQLQSGKPQAGAQVQVVGKDGKTTFAAKTDTNGLVRLPGIEALLPKPVKSGAIKLREDEASVGSLDDLLITASTADDFAITAGNWSDGIAPWRFGVNYAWRGEDAVVRGLLFTDRGMYRPGETAHFKGIVREALPTGLRVPALKQAHVTVTDARESEVFSGDVPVSAYGGFDFDLPIHDAAGLGDWTVKATVGDANLRQQFLVQEFRKQTFEVKVAGPQLQAAKPGPLSFAVTARYLFGAPVAKAPIAWTLLKRPHDIAFKSYAEFSFGSNSERYSYGEDGDEAAQTAAEGTATTDALGQATVSVTPALEDGADPIDYMLRAEVVDAANDKAAGSAVATYYPTTALLGLDSPWYAQAGIPLAAKVAAVDAAGQPVTIQATATLIRTDWVCTKRADIRYPDCKEVEVLSGRVEVSVTGTAVPLPLTPPLPGSYRIDVTARDSGGRKLSVVRALWVGGAGVASWRTDDDAKMNLIVSARSYRVGDTAQVMAQTAIRKGSALVTLEREGIMRADVTALTGAGSEFKLPIASGHMPNVFASVIVVAGQASAAHDRAPRMQMGIANLPVASDSERLQVLVEAARTAYEPGQEVTVTLHLSHAGKPVQGEIAVSVADEGVLLLADYKTPDPHKALYAEHPLGVATATNWTKLLLPSDPRENQEEEGGDAAARSQTRKRFLSSALWLPKVVSDENGLAVVRFAAPDNLTAFRVMAIAGDATAHLGSADQRITISKPLQAQPIAPRFVVPGDQVTLGVLVHNHTGQAGEATVHATATGLVLAQADQRVQLPAEGAVRVALQATATVGSEVTLRFEVALGAASDSVEITLPVVERLQYDRVLAGRGQVDGKSELQVAFVDQGLVDSESYLEIEVDRSGLSALQPALKALVEYPYGCLEQTLAKLMPMMLAHQLSAQAAVGGVDAKQLDAFIAAGMLKLQRFQSQDGQFSLWMGGHGEPHYTVIAMQAIAMAQRTGVHVDSTLAKQGWQALQGWVDQNTAATVGNTQTTLALAAAVLAEAGKPNAALNARLFEGRKTLTLFGQTELLRALFAAKAPAAQQAAVFDALVAAVKVDGDRARLPEPPDADRWWWPSDDDVRPTAALLLALLATKPAHPLVPKLAEHLLQAAKADGSWAHTHDNSYAVLALGAWARQQSSGQARVQVALNGQQLLDQTLTGNQLQHLRLPLRGQKPGPLTVTTQGPVRYLVRVQQARRDDKALAQRNGLAVTRTYLDPATGKPLLAIKAGQLVRVDVAVHADKDVAHVAVVDPLPAGLEAASLRVIASSDGSVAFLDEESEYATWQWTEVRDNEARAFANRLSAGDTTFSYLARALVAGTFTAAPATAEAMYAPEIHGRSAGQTVVVQ